MATSILSLLRNRSREQWLAAVAILTAVSYSALYVAYFQFYVSLGLRPADVGLTKLRLLQESLIALLLLPITRTVFMHPQFLLIALPVTAVATVLTGRRRGFTRAVLAERLAGALLSVTLLVGSALGVYGYVRMVYDASMLGDAVASDGYLTPSWTSNLGWPDIWRM